MPSPFADFRTDIIDFFAIPGGVSVSRRAAGANENGFVRPPTASTFVADATVHPANGRDLQNLPEGQRTRETIVLLTKVLLRTAESPAGGYADRVTYLGSIYEVANVQDFFAHAMYYRALAVKIDPEPAAP